jgi:hypothetical protein
MAVNAQYNVAKPDSLPIRVAAHQRRRMYELFARSLTPSSTDTIADIGVTSDRTYDHSNYLEAWYPHKASLTAVGIDDGHFLETLYPGLKFIQADGRNLPFESGSFDFVHSSAVLEHVGNHENQANFLRELWRVARKGIFVTTPNRWFPVEFHTVLPVIHWLPMRVYRGLLRASGRAFFADEENLNLLSRSSLRDVSLRAGISQFKIESVSLAGWTTNLILIADKSLA